MRFKRPAPLLELTKSTVDRSVDSQRVSRVSQISSLESEMDQLVGSGARAGSEVVALPCAAPGKRESFSLCEPQEMSAGLWVTDECFCGEEDQGEPELIKPLIKHCNH